MFNILRAHEKKFKDKGHITQAVNHNMRMHIDEHLKERIYPEKSHLNKLVFNSLGFDATKGGSDFQDKLFKHYEYLGIKAKPDSVFMLEFIISASPEFFETSTPQVVAAWEESQLEFLKEQFGGNLKLVVEHNDESSKHYHAFVSTELLSTKKYKNQKGEFFKETWSLNAKRFNPEFLTNLHDAHAVKNDRFGLLRGVEGSTALHTTLKDYQKHLKTVLKLSYADGVAKKVKTFFNAKSKWGFIPVDTATKMLNPLLNELKLGLEALKFHMADKEKRGKILEAEAERLKNKEKELNLLLDKYTKVLRDKNTQIEELTTENLELEKSNQVLLEKNQSQGVQIVGYQNKLKNSQVNYAK